MRRMIGATSVFLLLSLVFLVVADAAQRVARPAQKPLYCKVVLNRDGSKVLPVAFAESKGNGSGYDALYADVNFNGKFDGTEKVTARVRKCSLGIHCDFAPVKLRVPYSKEAAGVWYPCEVTFNYQKHSYPTRTPRVRTTGRIIRTSAVSASPTTTREDFQASAKVELRQGSTQWQYTFRGNVKPSGTMQGASEWSLLSSPKVTVTTRPDGQKKGNTGIGLTLEAGEGSFQCSRGGLPLKAHVEIKRSDGRVVHRGDATLDKFTFG
jgi:hypothetical protein